MHRVSGTGKGASLGALSSMNRRVVADCIRRHRKGISRSAIADLTGLSPQTVGNATKKLLAEQLIHEVGTAQGAMGKPRTLLALSPRGMYTIGIHVDPLAAELTVLNLAGETVAGSSVPLSPDSDPAQTLSEVSRQLRALVANSQIEWTKITGIGFAAPGPLDPATGMVVDPPMLPAWRNVPVTQLIEEQFGLPVVLEKDVIAAAQGELWLSPRHPNQSFAFLYLGAGTGFAFVQDGNLARGVSGNAGEIGHIQGPGDHPVCPQCRGHHLGPGMTPEIWVRGDPSATQAFAATGRLQDGVTALLERAKVGDPAATQVLITATDSIARAIAVASDLLDLDEVVIGGPCWTPVQAFIQPRLGHLLSQYTVLNSVRPIHIRTSARSSEVAVIGAAALAMDAQFAL